MRDPDRPRGLARAILLACLVCAGMPPPAHGDAGTAELLLFGNSALEGPVLRATPLG
jgi:hypothetical protein